MTNSTITSTGDPVGVAHAEDARGGVGVEDVGVHLGCLPVALTALAEQEVVRSQIQPLTEQAQLGGVGLGHVLLPARHGTLAQVAPVRPHAYAELLLSKPRFLPDSGQPRAKRVGWIGFSLHGRKSNHI